jgi:hypothetical protein
MQSRMTVKPVMFRRRIHLMVLYGGWYYLAVRWLGTTLDGQTDCFKIDRICLSVVNPLSVRWLGTTLDGQIDCFKIDRFQN